MSSGDILLLIAIIAGVGLLIFWLSRGSKPAPGEASDRRMNMVDGDRPGGGD